jgi:hypothetical protein
MAKENGAAELLLPAAGKGSEQPLVESGSVFDDDADVGDDSTTAAAAAGGGSCYCYCPPDRTSGQCYNTSSAKPSACDAFLPKGAAPGACPGIGVVKECGSVGADDCSSNMTMTSGGEFRCDKPCLDCTLAQSCGSNSKEGGAGGAGGGVSRCDCKVTAFYSCTYDPKPCVSSPYFP